MVTIRRKKEETEENLDKVGEWVNEVWYTQYLIPNFS